MNYARKFIVILTLTPAIVAADSNLYPRILKDGIVQPARVITILLEDNEPVIDNVVEPITYETLAALHQKACPLLVSGWLLKNIFNRKPIVNLPVIKSPWIVRGDTLVDVVAHNFDASEWDIYQVNESLYLLIPHTYTASLGEEPPRQDDLSGKSLLQGLKIDSLEQVYFATLKENLIGLKEQYSPPKDYFVQLLQNSIFIPSADYKNKDLIPQWNIYIAGHGQLYYTIAGLSIGEFKTMLSFFDGPILTKMLWYNSCYALGANAELISKDIQYKSGVRYKFPMLAEGTPNRRKASCHAAHTDPSGLEFLDFCIRLDRFTQHTISNEPISYEKLWQDTADLELFSMMHRNIPHSLFIRKAGEMEFKPLLQTVEIGTLMGATRKDPLDIKAYAKQRGAESKRIYIVIATPKVAFPLVIKGLEVTPFIISMIPFTLTMHGTLITKMVSQFTLAELLKSGAFVSEHSRYLIRELTGSKYSDIIVDFPAKEPVVYAKKDNKIVTISHDLKETAAEPGMIKYYNDVWSKAGEILSPALELPVLTNKAAQLMQKGVAIDDIGMIRAAIKAGATINDTTIKAARTPATQNFLKAKRATLQKISQIKEVIKKLKATPGYSRDPEDITVEYEGRQRDIDWLTKELKRLEAALYGN